LKRFVAKNLGQHEELDVEFGPGCTGVMGPNGVGKSTGLVLGPYSTLTNDWKWDDRKKEQCIRLDSEGPSYGQVFLEHKGHEIEVLRGLRGKRSHLIIDGGKPTLGDDAIDLELFKTLESPKKFLGQFLFIQQFMLRQWISSSVTDRQESMGYLFGIEKAKKLWDMLKSQRAKHEWTVGQELEDTDALSREIKDLTSQADKLTVDRSSHVPLTAEELRGHRDLIAKRQRYVQVWQRRKELKELLPGEEEKVAGVKALVTSAEADAAIAVKERDALQVQAEEIRQRSSAWAVYEQSVATFDRLTAERDAALKARQDVQEAITGLGGSPLTPEEFTQLHSELDDLRAEVKRVERILQNIASGEPVCGECGTPMKSVASKKAAYEKELVGHKKKVDKLSKQLSAQDAWEKADRILDEKLSRAVETLRAVETKLSSHVVGVKVKAPTQEERKIPVYANSAVRLADEKLQAAAKAQQDLASLDGRLSQMREQLEKLATEETELKTTKADAEAAQRALDKDQASREKALTLDGQIKVLRVQIDEKSKRLESLIRKRKQLHRAHDWINLVDRARARLHRDNIARDVGNDYLALMEGELNELLAGFGAPFVVEGSDDLSFTCTKPDGRSCPAAWLSGGEKILLSLCFRLVVHETFASQLGVMVLDEPTDALDARNLDFLRTSLEGLRSLVADRQLQLIIVTHHEQLASVFDQVIRLERVA
jgi:DNA repair exonuclease SbcCD ATPase subunit